MNSPPETHPEGGFTAVVLAAQRAGEVDPLALEAGLSHKCLVPIAGLPLIVHVSDTLQSTPGLRRLRIVIERDAAADVRHVVKAGPVPVEFVVAADNLADSVLAATRDLDEPTIVTTADNVLLTPAAVEQVLHSIRGGADVAIAMAAKTSVLRAHPEGQRRFYRFREDSYSNCNLYAFSGASAFAAAESFRSGGQFAKKPLRLLGAVGLLILVLALLRRLSLAEVLARLSRRLQLRIVPVILADGAHAIDVDNRRTYDAAAQLLSARRPSNTAFGSAQNKDPILAAA